MSTTGATTADPSASFMQQQATPGPSTERAKVDLKPNAQAANRLTWNEWGTQWTSPATGNAAGEAGALWANTDEGRQPWWRKRPRGKKNKNKTTP